FRLRQADAANLRMAIGRIRDFVQIDWLVFFPGDLGNSNDSFHRADVRQLWRAQNDVADGVDARLIGLHPFIGFDKAALGFDAGFFQAGVVGVWLAADGDQDFFGFNLLLLTV